jgi:hypothetical protein
MEPRRLGKQGLTVSARDPGHGRDGGLLAGDDARRAKLNGPTSAHPILTTAELISTLQAGPTAAD